MRFDAAKVGRGLLVYLTLVTVLYGTVSLGQRTAIAQTLKEYEGWKPLPGNKPWPRLPASGTATGAWDSPPE